MAAIANLGVSVAALLVLLAGCAPQPSTVTVFAAASLTEALEQIAEAFETENPGVEVVLSFAGSSTLASQIDAGAPADVFAAASSAAMGGREAQVFATNVLAIAVPAGNPGGVTGLEDFADPAKAIALCAPEVPCGSAAAALLAENRITPSVDTFEHDVRAVLTKVELGEVDAGLVYVTDVRASTGVEGVAVDSEPVDYPIASLTEKGEAFVAFVLSPAGQSILREAGFGAP